jgi:hypothetical protein
MLDPNQMIFLTTVVWEGIFCCLKRYIPPSLPYQIPNKFLEHEDGEDEFGLLLSSVEGILMPGRFGRWN